MRQVLLVVLYLWQEKTSFSQILPFSDHECHFSPHFSRLFFSDHWSKHFPLLAFLPKETRKLGIIRYLFFSIFRRDRPSFCSSTVHLRKRCLSTYAYCIVCARVIILSIGVVIIRHFLQFPIPKVTFSEDRHGVNNHEIVTSQAHVLVNKTR